MQLGSAPHLRLGRAINTDQEQARQRFLEGIEHFEAERFIDARRCFESALAVAPGRPSVLGNLGITLFHLRQWLEAIPVLQQTTASDPSYADAWIALGLSHEALGQWQPAVDCLLRGLALGPERAGLWLVCGQCRLRLGWVDLALQAFDHALRVDPNLADAWSARGDVLRELHRLEEAAPCFEKAIALGADADLHRFYLASVRADGGTPESPRRYVESLFDEYAADFQSHLVAKLRYQAPELLLRPLLRAGRRYRSVLDLGCGTGLCGSLIQSLADVIDGVDVSSAMLEQAQRLGVYRDLTHADLASFLAATERSADLVLAVDVFVYVGELTRIFAAVRHILEPDGCFAFTVERSTDGQDVRLLPSLRYAHSESYLRGLARTHGFELRNLFSAPIRYHQSEPVQGLYVYLA